jgi:hypothetical protein
MMFLIFTRPVSMVKNIHLVLAYAWACTQRNIPGRLLEPREMSLCLSAVDSWSKVQVC